MPDGYNCCHHREAPLLDIATARGYLQDVMFKRSIAILFIFCQLFLTAVTSFACTAAPASEPSAATISDTDSCKKRCVNAASGANIAEIRVRIATCEAPIMVLARLDILLGYHDVGAPPRADHVPEFLASYLRGTFLRHSVFLI